ncbi:MAG: F0F1 ATP synthase subunit delta [Pseudomonadota bacterium]
MADAQSDVAERYATAFFELAAEQGAIDALEADLVAISQGLQESDDLRRLVASPVFDGEQKAHGFGAVLEKAGAHELTRNFIGLLARNNRLGVITDVIRVFRRLAADHRGEVSAQAISAHPLTEDQTKSLRSQIEASVGKAVNLGTHVEKDLLGGLIVKVGSRMIDSSLRTKLNRLQQTLKEA